jgi:hypothetical protein
MKTQFLKMFNDLIIVFDLGDYKFHSSSCGPSRSHIDTYGLNLKL